MNFSLSPDVAAPYPGLRSFRRDESVIFFGRDQQIDDVLSRLKQHQFLGVVGTSGCGKSSLIRAGVLPALTSGLMGELGSSWFVADMKPGDAPLTNLAKSLIQSGVLGDRWSNTPEGTALLTAALRRSDLSLVNLIQQAGLPKYTNLLVLADQFEEIFRFQQSDPNEALAFVNLLLTTVRDRSVPIYVVLTMRSDYLGSCALFSGLPEALNDAQYLCPRLTRDQLAKAIQGPASVFGGEVERALVTQIVNDAGANSDQLPLVQHVLARIWRTRQPSERGPNPESGEIVLRLKDYQDRGGLNGYSTIPSVTQGAVGGSESSSIRYGIGPSSSYRQNALSEHADDAYLSLGDSQHESRVSGPDHKPSRKQVIAQMLFRSLAERGPSGQYVRRPVKVQDVAAAAGCSDAEVIEVVEVFRREDRSFLVPPVGVKLDAQSVLDISHEALIRQWQRFGGQSEQADGTDAAQSWLAIEEQSRRRYRRLAEAADSEMTSGLLKDPELSFLDKWWQEFQPRETWANGCVRDSFQRTTTYLQASKQAKRKGTMKRAMAFTIVSILALVVVGALFELYRLKAKNAFHSNVEEGAEGVASIRFGTFTLSKKDAHPSVLRAFSNSYLFSGATILWVDDHPENNDELRRLFKNLGATVLLAKNTIEANEAHRTHHIDVVISDVHRDDKSDEKKVSDFADRVSAPWGVIFYTAELMPPDPPVKTAFFAITNRPDHLIDRVTDLLERRWFTTPGSSDYLGRLRILWF